MEATTSAPPPDATVIIPVHDGELVLPDTLRALVEQRTRHALRVIIVCNGCRDASVSVAQGWRDVFGSHGHDCMVVQRRTGDRAAALNAASEHESGLRIYLDQDAVLSDGAIDALLERAADGFHFLTLRPALRAPVGRLVGRYFSAWNSLPYVRESPATMGLYAVSAAGRQRWVAFPLLHSDDKFARLHFEPHERVRVDSHTYAVCPAGSVAELIRQRSRYASGNTDLRRRHPELSARDVTRFGGCMELLCHPTSWRDAAVLGGVHAVAGLSQAFARSRPRTHS